jgi:hypothetical protein
MLLHALALGPRVLKFQGRQGFKRNECALQARKMGLKCMSRAFNWRARRDSNAGPSA